MNEYAVIVAGGMGTRMNNSVPKQFLLLQNRPVLMQTILRFAAYNPKIELVVGLPDDQFGQWDDLCGKYNFSVPHNVVGGGETRFQTVKECLLYLKGKEGLVAIHDGVRPLIHPNTIAASFKLADNNKGAIASVRLKETIRYIDQDTSRATDRSKYRTIQTPQTFVLSDIQKAYSIKEEPWMTDDAGVAEKSGINISLFEGGYQNIKITTPEDLIMAEALFKTTAG